MMFYVCMFDEYLLIGFSYMIILYYFDWLFLVLERNFYFLFFVEYYIYIEIVFYCLLGTKLRLIVR